VKASGSGPAFMDRAGEQNTARVGAIQGLHPNAEPAAVGQFFRDQLAAMDAAGQTRVAGARGVVQSGTEALGGRGAPATYGQEMRGAIQSELEPVKARESKLWGAVDPKGELALDVTPLRDAGKAILADITKSDTMTGPERAIVGHVAGINEPVILFSELQTLRSNISSALRKTVAGEPLSSRGTRRLMQLKAAVDDSLARAVEEQVTREAEAVSSGQMAPGQGIASRLTSIGDADGGAAQTAGVGGRQGHIQDSDAGVRGPLPGGVPDAGGAAGVPPGAGYPDAGGRSRGLGGGDSQLAAAPANVGRERRPQSLLEWITARGGIKPDSDLTAMGANDYHHQAGGRLVSRNGQQADYIREAGIAEGFWPADADINVVKNAIADELSGTKRYRAHEEAIARDLEKQTYQARLHDDAYYSARSGVAQAVDQEGVRVTPAQMQHATDLVAREGMHPGEAIRQALRGDEDRALSRNTQRDALNLRPGVQIEAQQGELGVSRAPPLQANLDKRAAAAYDVAREATLKKHERFGQGEVGKVLARGPDGAPHNVLDAAVPAKFFSGLATEPAQVQAFLKAAGPERGAALARDYLVSDLRRGGIINTDGTVNADAFAKWQKRRVETIKLFPGLGDEFASVEMAQRAFDDVTAAHTTALKDYQSGVAKRFLNDEPNRAVQSIMGSADRVKLMQQAIEKVQGNADALESLKGHVVDYMIDKLTTSAKASEANAATPGIAEAGGLRADAFKGFVADNKPWLRRMFGGQGMQNLEMVAADLQRQQLRTQATAGSATAERGAAVASHGGWRPQTVPTLLGIMAAEAGGSAIGLPGVATFATGAPILAHVFRQRGIQTVNDLVREAMLHPSVARELMARPKQASLNSIAQRRIASALQGVVAAQSQTGDRAE
jgi:hypothetical protein